MKCGRSQVRDNLSQVPVEQRDTVFPYFYQPVDNAIMRSVGKSTKYSQNLVDVLFTTIDTTGKVRACIHDNIINMVLAKINK